MELLITLVLVSVLSIGITSSYKYFRYKNSANSIERIITSMIDYSRIYALGKQQVCWLLLWIITGAKGDVFANIYLILAAKRMITY